MRKIKGREEKDESVTLSFRVENTVRSSRQM